MARPITLSKALIDKYIAEFAEELQKVKLSDGKVSFSKELTYEDGGAGATVKFTPSAYAKMLALLDRFKTEVAWHGTVVREPDNVFRITDILVYPQVVTGATAAMDEEAYDPWFIGLDDDTANALHMQGHSHVDFACNPSGPDLTSWDRFIRQIPPNGFYIFMIFNKKLERHIKIYDMATNTLFENKDVKVVIDSSEDLEDFIKGAESMVQQRAVSYAAPHASYGGYTLGRHSALSALDAKEAAVTAAKKTAPKTTTKAKAKAGAKKATKSAFPPVLDQFDEETDYDQMIFGRRYPEDF